MIISVDTVRDSPETMKAAAKLILEIAGGSAPREPMPPLRVEPAMRTEQPTPAVPAPQRFEPKAPEVRPVMKAPEPKAPEPTGFEELGLEVYDDNEPTPRSVSVTLANRKDDESKTEKQPEKPSRLPGNVQVY